MFDRSPGFLLSKQQCIQNMAMDLLKFESAEKKMNAEELKEWAARRIARAKVIEKLGNYESCESSDWQGEVAHNFMRNMREVGNFDSLAMTPFLLKGRKNQTWTVIETSSSLKRKVIRFYTVRNDREIPFTFVLEKVVKCHQLLDKESSGLYNLTIHKGAKFANQDKFENDVKQFFASTRHLYDFITNEIWSHIDTMPPLPIKNAKTSKNFRNLLEPIPETQTPSVEPEKSVPSIESPKEVQNSSDQNIRRNNGIMMQNRRRDQGIARGGVIQRGSHNSHSLNNSYFRGAYHTNSTLRSNYGVNKENGRYNSHSSNTNLTRSTTQDMRKSSGFRTNTYFAPTSSNKEGTISNFRKDLHEEVQSTAQRPEIVTYDMQSKTSSSASKDTITTTKLETPKDVLGPSQSINNKENVHGEKAMHSRGGSFNSSRNFNNIKSQ